MNEKNLKPASVFYYFEEICKVPRPSKREEKIIAYLKAFGREHGLETKTDEVGNVLIKKPATPGKENLKTVILQSHIDMVCEKNSDVEHDFLIDPIETVVDGEWLKAKGTTLGADNGIGVATELAILAATDIEHGPLECLFTVDEETGLTGAFALKPGFMTGDILINLDSEDEGELFIGCAGGANTTAEFTYQPVSAPQDYFYFRVAVKGLTGGHSGDDINKGRANANKLLNRFLTQLASKYILYLCEIDGGNLHNAIPREAQALCAVPMKDKESVRVDLNIYTAELENEYAATEPNLVFLAEYFFHFFTGSGIIHPHLGKEMEIIEVGTAFIIIRTALHLFDDMVHDCTHSCHILFYKFSQCFHQPGKLVGRCLHLYDIFVCYRHKQVEFMRKIIYYPRLYHPAGFRQHADTRFLVVHPQKHLECLVYHFFSVGNHIGLSSFMFLFAKVCFLF